MQGIHSLGNDLANRRFQIFLLCDQGRCFEFRFVESQVGFFLIVEEREEPIVFFLFYRIEFVIMALSTTYGKSKPHSARGRDAIKDAVDTKLLWINTAFLVDLGIAMKSCGHALVVGGVWQQVSCYLFDRELVERQIAIEGIDDPIAVLPNLTRCIDGVAIAVGVASLIEPPSAPSFAVIRTSQ